MNTATYMSHNEATLRDAATAAVEHAERLGTDGASVTVQAGGGVRLVVREGVTETRLRDDFQSIGITVYRDGRSGSASATAFDADAVRRIAQEAVAIAARVQPDADAGLANPEWLAREGDMPPLFSPAGIAPDALLAQAHAIDEAVRAVAAGRAVFTSEAGVATSEGAMALATSTGFCRSVATTTHGRWAMVLAQGEGGSVQDFAQSQERVADRLSEPDALAALAIERAIGQLGARPLVGGRLPILFDARVAGALVRDLVAALSGGPQYRRASWLLDAAGRQMLADHLDLVEDPGEPWGLASGGFDGEGVAGSRRHVVMGGVVNGYFLSALSARRLGTRSTGNAGGAWNLRFASRRAGGDAAAMRARLGSGLLVTQIMGGATDPVTGNWTRAVAGFRVEDGAIVHPVTDVTLGGSLPEMMQTIVAIGDDVDRQGAVRCGSILIDAMTVGVAA